MTFTPVERKIGGGDKIDNDCVSSVRERNGHLLKLLTSVVAVVRKDLAEQMASTIRHNRTRGMHKIELMTRLVRELT